jgi:acyl-CoA thioester hydrolase
MIEHRMINRVRYYETDQMGYLHHSNYTRYYELARTDAMRSIGFSYAQAEQSGTIMPVIKIESKFMKPLFYDDEVEILTIIHEIPRMGIIKFDHEFYNSEKELVHTGSVVLAMIEKSTNKRMNGPQEFMDLFLKAFHGQ